MGAAWCKSEEECIDRAYDPTKCYRGSSNVSCFNANGDKEPGVDFNQTMDFRDVPAINGARWGGGLLISDPTTNPLTHDWSVPQNYLGVITTQLLNPCFPVFHPVQLSRPVL